MREQRNEFVYKKAGRRGEIVTMNKIKIYALFAYSKWSKWRTGRKPRDACSPLNYLIHIESKLIARPRRVHSTKARTTITHQIIKTKQNPYTEISDYPETKSLSRQLYWKFNFFKLVISKLYFPTSHEEYDMWASFWNSPAFNPQRSVYELE